MARPIKWTKKRLQEVASECKNKKSFRLGAKDAYRAACFYGYLDELGLAQTGPRLWTYEAILAKAIESKSLAVFRKSYKSAYSIASARGWLSSLKLELLQLESSSGGSNTSSQCSAFELQELYSESLS
ncbi:MAG: hypothetical protein RI996_392 [Candidatus Parcubacteria bacterium]|jgi:hypothetical protein